MLANLNSNNHRSLPTDFIIFLWSSKWTVNLLIILNSETCLRKTRSQLLSDPQPETCRDMAGDLFTIRGFCRIIAPPGSVFFSMAKFFSKLWAEVWLLLFKELASCSENHFVSSVWRKGAALWPNNKQTRDKQITEDILLEFLYSPSFWDLNISGANFDLTWLFHY